MSFKDKDFQDRFNDPMWHHSEDKFEELFPGIWDRFGLDQGGAKIDTWNLPAFVRHTPDYACQLKKRGKTFLVEVQGTGKDRKHKFKFDKLEVIKRWNREIDVWFWLWDDKLKRPCIISYNKLSLLIARGEAERGTFDGKRPYWALPVNVVTAASDWDPERYT